MKRMSYRLGLTVSREMIVALDVLAAKSGLALTTQAMVLLRQALDRTISSEPVQLRLKQDRAFASRDQWLMDRQTETYVENAVRAAEGIADDAPPA
jgi:hypothetical protein